MAFFLLGRRALVDRSPENLSPRPVPTIKRNRGFLA